MKNILFLLLHQAPHVGKAPRGGHEAWLLPSHKPPRFCIWSKCHG